MLEPTRTASPAPARRRTALVIAVTGAALAASLSLCALVLTAGAVAESRRAEVPASETSERAEAPAPIDGSATGATDATGGGASPFGDSDTVTRLDPALLEALRRAAEAARAEGVELLVTSGWRSPAEQEALLRQAIADYGSAEEASRWVAGPESSEHVSGDAVDVGPWEAAAWLSEHGAAYGLCQIYDNEAWHYELRPGAALAGCPPTYADAAEDPRMQR